MPDTNMPRQANQSTQATELDALVIGAGFSGMYQLLCLRDRLGLSAKVLEAGDGVGGTWSYDGLWVSIEADASGTDDYMFLGAPAISPGAVPWLPVPSCRHCR